MAMDGKLLAESAHFRDRAHTIPSFEARLLKT
jgi:hypothetical protein